MTDLPNPVALLLERCDTGVREFERLYGFAHATMNDALRGTFENISTRLNESLGSLCYSKGIDGHGELLVVYGNASLDNAYRMWRISERLKFASAFNEHPPENRFTRGLSPAYFWVSDTAGGATAFSKMLKIPRATVTRWLEGETRTMPKAIHEALTEIRFPYIAELVDYQTAWIDGHTK